MMQRIAGRGWLAGLLVLAAAFAMQGCVPLFTESEPVPPMEQVEALTTYIGDELNLTEEQRHSVRRIIMENLQIKRRIHQQYAGRPMELEDAHQSRLRKFENQVHAVLLKQELREKWDKVAKRIRARELSEVRARTRQPQSGPGAMPGGMGY